MWSRAQSKDHLSSLHLTRPLAPYQTKQNKTIRKVYMIRIIFPFVVGGALCAVFPKVFAVSFEGDLDCLDHRFAYPGDLCALPASGIFVPDVYTWRLSKGIIMCFLKEHDS